MALRIVFMGTPEFSVATLRNIIAAGHVVPAVYTQPPRPAGRRGLAETKSPVHAFAEQAGISVFCPKTLRGPEAAEIFRSHEADVGVVVAYGMILPASILEIPPMGCLNLHASALPRWRGAAPIQRAIMAGDRETAVMVMRMQTGLDTGPVGLEERVAIGADTTAGELHDRLSHSGAALMVRALAALEQGALVFTPQSEEGVTYARKIEKGDARISFGQCALAVHNLIRGLSPFPGAWFEVLREDAAERIKVLRSELVREDASHAHQVAGTVLDERLTVACGTGAVRLLELQRAGRKPMMGEEFLRGFPLPPGTLLGSE